jgi:hypothetical protein
LKIILFTLNLLLLTSFAFAQIKSNIIDVNTILINGKIPITTSKNSLEVYFGKNYKKEKYEPGCGSFDQEEFYDVKFFLYKKNGMDFIVYKTKAEFDQIDLTKADSNFVQVGKFKITNQTTLQDLKKYFPKSYKEYKEEFKKPNEAPVLRFFYDKVSEDYFIIKLNNKNKVVTCSCFSPC